MEEEYQDESINKQKISENLVLKESTQEEFETNFDVDESEAEGLVEAALFVAGRYLTLSELLVLTDINPITLKSVLYSLEKKYSSGTLRIIRRKESYKMDIAEKYHYLINKLATGSAEFTKAEKETLAIIAYKQPVKQSVVIKIRGNKSYDHIKKFRNLGLVHAKQDGHTLVLSLSEEFYEYFNVSKNDNNSTQGQEEKSEAN